MDKPNVIITYKGFPDSSAGKESACNEGDFSLIPGLERYPGEGIGYPLQCSWASLVVQLVKSACNAGDLSSIPALERSPGEGKGYALHYSGLENSMDYTVHRVSKTHTVEYYSALTSKFNACCNMNGP